MTGSISSTRTASGLSIHVDRQDKLIQWLKQCGLQGTKSLKCHEKTVSCKHEKRCSSTIGSQGELSICPFSIPVCPLQGHKPILEATITRQGITLDNAQAIARHTHHSHTHSYIQAIWQIPLTLASVWGETKREYSNSTHAEVLHLFYIYKIPAVLDSTSTDWVKDNVVQETLAGMYNFWAIWRRAEIHKQVLCKLILYPECMGVSDLVVSLGNWLNCSHKSLSLVIRVVL